MYPASKDGDQDSQHSSARFLRFGAKVEKFFILTPSSHFVNPKFVKQQVSPPHHVRFRDDTKLPKHVHAPKSSSIRPASNRGEDGELHSPPSSDTSTITELSHLPADVGSSLASPVPVTVNSVQTTETTQPRAGSGTQEKYSDISEEDEDDPSVNVVSMGDSSNFGGQTALEVLTRKFVKMLGKASSSSPQQHHKKSFSLNIAEAAIQLEVPQKRLRDIASVLEGAGLIEQSGDEKYTVIRHEAAPLSNDDNNVPPRRNRTAKRPSYATLSPTRSSSSSDSDDIAVGRPPKLQKTVSAPFSPCFAALQDENDRLANEEHQLDAYIDYLSKQIHSYKKMHQVLYLSFNDIKSIPGFAYDATILGIKAPPGTTLEVPDPEVTKNHNVDNAAFNGTRRYEIHLTSRTSSHGATKSSSSTGLELHDPIRVHAIRPNISLEVPSGKIRQRQATFSSSEEEDEVNHQYHSRRGFQEYKYLSKSMPSSRHLRRSVKSKSSIEGILRKRRRSNSGTAKKVNQANSISSRQRKTRLLPSTSLPSSLSSSSATSYINNNISTTMTKRSYHYPIQSYRHRV